MNQPKRPSVHVLKCWPEYFAKIWDGEKPFEIRKNDRDYRVGDILDIREWLPQIENFTGRGLRKIVSYMTDFQQQPGFVVMGLKDIDMSPTTVDLESRQPAT